MLSALCEPDVKAGGSPYRTAHWVLLATASGFFIWLIVLAASWAQDWATVSKVVAALLGVGGSVVGVRWSHDREALERLGPRPAPTPSDEDWERGES